MSSLTVNVNDQSYTGHQIRPTVKDSNNNTQITAKLGTVNIDLGQFTISYPDSKDANKEVGTGTLTLAPKASNKNFTGSKEVFFKIVGQKIIWSNDLFRFNRCLAADDIKDFFVLFVVMVTIGMFSGLNLHEVGRALGNVFDNRLNAEPVIALGLHLCGNFTVIFYNYFFHLFSPKMIAFKNNNFIMTFRLKCKVGTILL